MKLKTLLLLGLPVLFIGCVKNDTNHQQKNSAMLLDSSYTGDKNATVVHAGDTLRMTETMKSFAENPNIMQADLDAVNRTPSKEVQYVKKGDTLRISEVFNKKRKR